MPCERVLSGTSDYLFAAVGHAPLNCICHFTAPLPLNCSPPPCRVVQTPLGLFDVGAASLRAESPAPVSLSKLARRAQLSSLYWRRAQLPSFYVNLIGEPSSQGCTESPAPFFLTEPFRFRVGGRVGRCPLPWRPQPRTWLPTGWLRRLSAKPGSERRRTLGHGRGVADRRCPVGLAVLAAARGRRSDGGSVRSTGWPWRCGTTLPSTGAARLRGQARARVVPGQAGA